jgi:hypothetical protein
MAAEQMVIFTRTFDLLTWLLPHTNKFPRAHRQTVTRRLLDAAFDLRELLEMANLRQGAARRAALLKADEALAKIRMYLRLASKWGWQTDAQIRRVSEGIPFLGFRVWPARRRVKPRKVVHAGRRLRALADEVGRGRATPRALTEAVVAWVNHVSKANTVGLRKSVLRGVRG